MKIFLICLTIFVALCFVAAYLFVQSADNVDARATAGLVYLPCVGLAILDLVLWVLWGIYEII